MNSAPPAREQHLLATAVRLSEMLAIALVGIGAALLCGTLGSVAHFLLRHKPVKVILRGDAIPAAGFLLLLVAA